MSAAELSRLVQSQAETITSLQQQLDWFRRQIFGAKSERFAPEPDPTQMHLGEVLPVPAQPPEQRPTIPAHSRRVAKRDRANTGETVPFFDESRVPVESIILIDAATKQLDPDQFDVIDEKVSYRLAQRPGSYVVLKYVRPVTLSLKSLTTASAGDPAMSTASAFL